MGSEDIDRYTVIMAVFTVFAVTELLSGLLDGLLLNGLLSGLLLG